MTSPGWLSATMRVPCSIIPRVASGVDEYGNPEYDDGTPVDTYCYIQPVSQIEIQDGRAEVGSFLVHLDASLAGIIDGFSRLDALGLSFEVQGPPAVYPDIDTGAPHHVECYVNRSTA